MESNLVDPEEVQHCLRGSQKDHQVMQPVKTDRRNYISDSEQLC